MSIDKNKISDQIEKGLEIEKDFNLWIDKNKWMWIVPLKHFQHPRKEIYKTYDELKEMYLKSIIG